jgi:quercetin dioxygenase-like cupin family protein
METRTWRTAPSLNPVEGVKISIIGDGTNITYCCITCKPGAKIDNHRHHNEQIGTCIQGQGILVSGSNTIKVKPGLSWLVPSNEIHKFIAEGDEEVILIEAFSPPRLDYTSVAK